jgi:hypothetical protein
MENQSVAASMIVISATVTSDIEIQESDMTLANYVKRS